MNFKNPISLNKVAGKIGLFIYLITYHLLNNCIICLLYHHRHLFSYLLSNYVYTLCIKYV